LVASPSASCQLSASFAFAPASARIETMRLREPVL
jgi:hypothetical protein